MQETHGPLTRQEQEMAEIKEQESRVDISVDSKHNTLAQLSFPFNDQAINALEQYKQMQSDYVQLSIGRPSLCYRSMFIFI